MMGDELPESTFDKMQVFKTGLMEHATGGEIDAQEFEILRKILMTDHALNHVRPKFLNICRSPHEFWQFIKSKFQHYAERRDFLTDEFEPLLQYLEQDFRAPSDDHNTEKLDLLKAEAIDDLWKKALQRRVDDPEGAITLARTLIESVCKAILDEDGMQYDEGEKLPALFKTVSRHLNLAPTQHTEVAIKDILNGTIKIVDGLGTLRNKLSDSHGRSTRLPVSPAPRHANLAVNSAGSIASFLVETWATRKSG